MKRFKPKTLPEGKLSENKREEPAAKPKNSNRIKKAKEKVDSHNDDLDNPKNINIKKDSDQSHDNINIKQNQFSMKKIFKFDNPPNKSHKSKEVSIQKTTTVAELIQHFNGISPDVFVIGFSYDNKKYTYEDDIPVLDIIKIEDSDKVINIHLLFETDSTTKAVDSKKKISDFTLIFIDDCKKIQLNPCDNIKKTVAAISKTLRLNRNESIVLYFPGGNIANSSYSDFIISSKTCKTHLYYVIINKSKYSPNEDDTETEICAKSIIQLFPDLMNDYVSLLCCILKYIEMQNFKSFHIIKSCYKKIHFVPFVTSLYRLYNKKVTKSSLFTIISFLLSYDNLNTIYNSLFRLFSNLCYFTSKNLTVDFKKAINIKDCSFTHDFNGSRQPHDFQDNVDVDFPSNAIFVVTPKELRARRYWSIVVYNEYFILARMYPFNSNKSKQNDVYYYDPFQKNSNKKFLTMKISDLDTRKDNATSDMLRKETLPNFKKYSQETVVIIDYSSSMIACFDEKGNRRSSVATEIVNRLVQAGSDLKINDPFAVLDFKCSGQIEIPMDHYKENFRKPSKLYDRLYKAIYFINKGAYADSLEENAYKRIVVVSDGFDVESTKNKKDVLSLLLKYHIILDAIILKRDESIKELCAISHLSGGYYYTPYEEEDAYFIAEYSKFADISQRNPLLNPIFYDKIDDSELDDKIDQTSKIIRIKNEINSIKMKFKDDFYENIDLYSPFSYINESPQNYQEKLIQKEIDICACYQRTESSKGKEPFFYIYRRFDNSNNIDKNQVIVFLKGNDDKTNRVIYQVSIQFTDAYPFQMPVINLLSNGKVEGRMQNKKFLLNISYTPGMRLLQILYELNKVLISQEKFVEKDNYFDPISSLNQIEVVFRIYDGTMKDINVDKKHLKLDSKYS